MLSRTPIFHRPDLSRTPNSRLSTLGLSAAVLSDIQSPSAANAKKGVVKFKNKQAVKDLIITGKTVKLYAVWKK